MSTNRVRVFFDPLIFLLLQFLLILLELGLELLAVSVVHVVGDEGHFG
jgi:hypothetical protein